MNDYNAAAISVGVVICGATFLLFFYLRDYTQFFERLSGTMEPEDYYKEKNISDYTDTSNIVWHSRDLDGLGKPRQILLKYADLPVWQIQNDGAILRIRTL